MNSVGLPTPVVATMSLRAPRIALLVPAVGNWQFTGMHAIHAMTLTWAGAGFVLVPVEPGGVHPALLLALREYDPDAVLMPEYGLIDEKHRPMLVEAQRAISSCCANYRAPLSDDAVVAAPTDGDLWQSIFCHGGPGSGQPNLLANVAEFPAEWKSISANPGVGGSLGLAASARWGLALPPQDNQVKVDEAVVRRAVTRLTSSDYAATDLLGVTDGPSFEGQFETVFARTLVGLDGAQGYGWNRAEALIVCGDSPADFALAMIWDRTYRMGVWVPEEWWQDDRLRVSVLLGTDRLSHDSYRSLRKLVFTSTSLDANALSTRVDEWVDGFTKVLGSERGAERIDTVEVLPPSDLPFTRDWKTHYVIRENLSHEWSTNVYETADGIEFAMLPRVPVVGVSGLEKLESQANWQVDITVRGYEIPCTTALPERSLLAEGQQLVPTRIRSGRNGISYEAYRTDFVHAGATLSQALTRPLPRYPSLLAWADARARTHSMSARVSAAGTQARILSAMMGGRDALADLMASELLPGLKAFNATHKTTSAEYPDGVGCVVNGEGFLHFRGICMRAGIDPDMTARHKIDDLLSTGVLRRGLLTLCPICGHTSFVQVDDLANTIRCQRCLNDNKLNQQLWRDPVEEPTWFYDLHPPARALLRGNGDVPLRLSQYLRDTSKLSFTDAPEFELLNGDGNPESETDLLALVDRRLVVAEAKSVNSIGDNRRKRNAAARKRALAASVFAADEVVLATSADSWDEASIAAMSSALRAQNWASGRGPRLRTIARLGGTGEVVDEMVG